MGFMFELRLFRRFEMSGSKSIATPFAIGKVALPQRYIDWGSYLGQMDVKMKDRKQLSLSWDMALISVSLLNKEAPCPEP
jgi:hypothetical protein